MRHWLTTRQVYVPGEGMVPAWSAYGRLAVVLVAVVGGVTALI